MPLPSAWVDRIHAKLLVRYGTAWVHMWRGVDMQAVKDDWAEYLSGASAGSIAYALEHLPPDRPPTVAQFADIARGCPVTPPKALPGPPADRARVDAILAKLRHFGRPNPRDEFFALKAREERGEQLTQAQREMWRAALGEEHKDVERGPSAW